MKNLILIFCLLAVFAACSDDETKTDGTNPFLPVAGLQIPKQEFLGREITLHGKGFEQGCAIQLQLNGADVFDTEVVTVTADSVVIRTPELESGFYLVLLTQGGKTFRIGGINLVPNNLEDKYVDAIGVVGEDNSKIYPVSLTKKMKGDSPLFALQGGHSFYGGIIIDQVWYYATYYLEEVYEGDKFIRMNKWYNIYAYDLNTKTNEVLKEKIEGFLALGVLGGQMHIFSYDTEKCYIQKWESGDFQKVLEFNNVSANKMISINEGIFLYDAAHHSLVMAGQDMAGSTRKLVWALSLDHPQIKEIGNATSIAFRLVDCGGTFYAFGEQVVDEDKGNVNTYVVRLDNPSDWAFANLKPEVILTDVFLGSPVYDPEKKIVYGIDDGETVISYDIQAKKVVGSKWVGSGLISLFLL